MSELFLKLLLFLGNHKNLLGRPNIAPIKQALMPFREINVERTLNGPCSLALNHWSVINYLIFQLSLAFFLTVHTLMVIAAYVMLLGNIYPTTSLTFVSILIVFTHLSAVEMLLRGLKKQVFSRIAPWFCLSLLDEMIVIGMGSSHLSHTIEELDGSFGRFMREKGALFVIGLVLFGKIFKFFFCFCC